MQELFKGGIENAMVIENVYDKLPGVLKLLLTKKEIDTMIENSVTYMKKYLKNNDKDLLGYGEEYQLE